MSFLMLDCIIIPRQTNSLLIRPRIRHWSCTRCRKIVFYQIIRRPIEEKLTDTDDNLRKTSGKFTRNSIDKRIYEFRTRILKST